MRISTTTAKNTHLKAAPEAAGQEERSVPLPISAPTCGEGEEVFDKKETLQETLDVMGLMIQQNVKDDERRECRAAAEEV